MRKNQTSRPSNEEWRPVKGFEGIYEVSSFGSVRSADRITHYSDGRTGRMSGKILSPTFAGGGYARVILVKDGIKFPKNVHRLVAEAFIPNPSNLPFIDHINCARNDNRVENLRWCTPRENNLNPITNRRMSISHLGKTMTKEAIEKRRRTLEETKGTEAYRQFIERKRRVRLCKPVEQYDKNGNKIAEYFSASEAARKLGLGSTTISYAAIGRIKTAGGYIWKYKNQNTGSPQAY